MYIIYEKKVYSVFTKCIKVTIKSCNNIDWKSLNKVLSDIRYMTCKASNKAMQMYYMWENEKIEYKNSTGEYPNEHDKFGKTYRNVVESEMKLIMNTVNTSNVSQTNAFVMKKWNTDKKDILSLKKSLANFKLDMPIFIYNKNFKISQGNKGYEVDCAIYNKSQDIKHFTFLIDKLDNNKKTTLNKIISGIYKQGSAQIIQDKKGKWYLIISFSFEPQTKSLDPERILGIDLGITNVATMQIWDCNNHDWDWLSYKECMIDGKELIHFRQKIYARNRQLSIASKCAGKGRIGHGYETRLKPVEVSRDKVNKFRDTYNHKTSRYIIDYAIKHNCGTIQMEDLSNFSNEQSQTLLKNWSYYDLQSKIEYKATEVGIIVKLIKPYMTSKRCSKCGCIDEANRDCKKNQAKFKCIVCNYEENADINAAKNISLPDIDKIIKEQLKIKG